MASGTSRARPGRCHRRQQEAHLRPGPASLPGRLHQSLGVIIAYTSKGTGDPAPDSRYNNQMNIFRKALLYSLIGVVLMAVLIGFLILLAALVWYIIRCVQGMQALSAEQPVENPGSWLL